MLEEYFERRQVHPDPALLGFLAQETPAPGSLLEALVVDPEDPALEALHDQLPPNYVPIDVVDDRSFACIVCQPANKPSDGLPGPVVRWFTVPIKDERRQAALLDVDADFYLASVSQELSAREAGLT